MELDDDDDDISVYVLFSDRQRVEDTVLRAGDDLQLRGPTEGSPTTPVTG